MKDNAKISLRFLFAMFLLLGLSWQNFAQTVGDAAVKKTKWQGLSGKNNEFNFLMPENFQTFADGNYFTVTAKGEKAQIDNRRTLVRYINGVVLMVEFYEGDATNLLAALTERQKGQSVRNENINGFQLESYVEKQPDFIWETQYFLIKNRLYVLKAVSRSEDNSSIVRDFFNSVRLVNQKKNFAAPNSVNSNPDSVTALPDISENQIERLDDSQALADKPDREPIILYKPRPKYSAEARSARVSGKVKLKALFSSSGKITKVEIVSSPARELNDAAIQAAEQIQFLPAEKNGKLVSLYKTVEYSFSTY